MSALVEKIQGLGACADSERDERLSRYETIADAWAEWDRADEMLWYVGAVDGALTPRLRLAAVACSRTALQYADDPRVAETLEVAERYALGKASKSELSQAWDAAGESAWAAWDAAGESAGESAWAAWDAAGESAGDAAWAARAAAWAAAWDAAGESAGDAAWAAALSEMADLVRQIIPDPDDPESLVWPVEVEEEVA